MWHGLQVCADVHRRLVVSLGDAGRSPGIGEILVGHQALQILWQTTASPVWY